MPYGVGAGGPMSLIHNTAKTASHVYLDISYSSIILLWRYGKQMCRICFWTM